MSDSEIAQQYADKTERLLAELQKIEAAKFSLGEILYISDLVTKVRWMTSKEHERKLFERLEALHGRVALGR